MAAAGDESAHKFPEGFEVYDDEKCMAAEAPSFEGLKDTWIAGEYVRYRVHLYGVVLVVKPDQVLSCAWF